MALTKQQKEKIIAKFSVKKKDTGSPEVQVALLTKRINSLADHLKNNKKDFHSKSGLLSMVSKRRRLLNYLQAKDEKRYQALIKKLKI